MKKIMLIPFFLCVSLSFAQTEITNNTEESVNSSCIVKDDFEEPKWVSTKIRTRNKTRVSDLKKYASVDTGIDIAKITLLVSNETAANGLYVLCVDGKELKYKRNGSVFNKN